MIMSIYVLYENCVLNLKTPNRPSPNAKRVYTDLEGKNEEKKKNEPNQMYAGSEVQAAEKS